MAETVTIETNASDATLVVDFDVFSYMLDIGEAMLTSGADVHTVEHMLARMGRAYGAYKMNVNAPMLSPLRSSKLGTGSSSVGSIRTARVLPYLTRKVAGIR